MTARARKAGSAGEPAAEGADARGRADRARKPARRRRGRPARLSRDGVIDAVLAMLERTPDEPLTITRIAQQVEAAPAALYRHFDRLEDLLDGVLARVLAAHESALTAGEPWDRRLAEWMTGLRRHLLQYPAVIALIGRSDQTSPAWFESASALVEILERAGLTGRDLAITYLWILETTTGLILQEAKYSLPEQIARARAARGALSDTTRGRFALVARELDRLDGEEFFAFAVEQATTLVRLRLEA